MAYRSGYVSLPSITRTYLFLDEVLRQSNNGSPPAGWPADWGANTVDYGIDPDVVALEGEQRVKDALQAIPTWSITTDLANLFDPATGIYANAWQDGRDWERPASVEMFNPDGFADGTRTPARIPGQRGAADPRRLQPVAGQSQALFPAVLPRRVRRRDAGVSVVRPRGRVDLQEARLADQPELLVELRRLLRTTTSWPTCCPATCSATMGQPYTRSTWLHLYVNGQYWGLYQTQERAEAEFAATYFGGTAADYDVIKPEAGPYANYATDGNMDAYTRLWEQARTKLPDGTPAFALQENYFKAQGQNPDGTDNPDYEVLLNVDNLVVYMIGILWGGNLDAPISNFLGNAYVNNYFAIRNRTAAKDFVFFQHDAEHTLRNLYINRNGPWTPTISKTARPTSIRNGCTSS